MHDGTTHLVYAELAVVHPHRVIDIAVRHLAVEFEMAVFAGCLRGIKRAFEGFRERYQVVSELYV